MKAKYQVRKFDTNFTEKFFKDRCQQLFREAAVEYVRWASYNVPSLTGQAKAALINVAKSIGVDPGVDPFDPPISEYEHLQIPLWLAGNTPQRGKKMGKSTIRKNKKSVTWNVIISITAAHSGFDYFTYWDRQRWNAIEQAEDSARRYLDDKWNEKVVLDLELTRWQK